MRLQYYVDEEGESTIGLWVPKRNCFIDVTAQDEQIWAAMLPSGKKLRKEIETYLWDEKAAQHGDERPIKEHDHAMDAVRYLCKTIVTRRRLAA